jgi:dihydropteroate synthase
MGVLNVTPDSFSDGGQLYQNQQVCLQQVLDRAELMVADGACVLDIGGESTRPGAQKVSQQEELRRVIPVVEALQELDIIISVDTRHATVAAAAIKAGAHFINDVGAGADAAMLSTVADAGVGYALMHMQGTPANMQQAPSYGDVVAEVQSFLAERVNVCRQAGVADDCLLVDPGFGFGKTVEHNLQLLAGLQQVRVDALPILVGLSRKSTIGAVTGRAVEARGHGSVAAALLAAERGADLIRVHDVAATMDALEMLRAVASQQDEQT